MERMWSDVSTMIQLPTAYLEVGDMEPRGDLEPSRAEAVQSTLII